MDWNKEYVTDKNWLTITSWALILLCLTELTEEKLPALLFVAIVRDVRALWELFGSDSSNSTKFGPYVAHTILFRFLTGAKTGTFWGCPCGFKKYTTIFFKDLFPSVSIYSPSEIKAVVSLKSGCSPPGHVSPITYPAQHCLVLTCQRQPLLMQAGRELMQACRGQGWDLSTTSGSVYFFYCPWPPLPPSANELPLFHST